MIFRTAPHKARWWRNVRHGALALVSLAVAHEVVYSWREGLAGVVPADEEHAYWPVMLLVVAVAAIGLAAWSLWRIRRASQALIGDLPRDAGDAGGYAVEWRRIFGRLLAVVATAYLVLENVEHLLAHGHLEGIVVYLAPDTLATFPLLVAVVAGFALLGAAVRWQELALVRAARRRPTLNRRRHTAVFVPRWSAEATLALYRLLLSSPDLGRAPPATSS